MKRKKIQARKEESPIQVNYETLSDAELQSCLNDLSRLYKASRHKEMRREYVRRIAEIKAIQDERSKH